MLVSSVEIILKKKYHLLFPLFSFYFLFFSHSQAFRFLFLLTFGTTNWETGLHFFFRLYLPTILMLFLVNISNSKNSFWQGYKLDSTLGHTLSEGWIWFDELVGYLDSTGCLGQTCISFNYFPRARNDV